MVWTSFESLKPTKVITVEKFLCKYGDYMLRQLSSTKPIEVEQTDEFIIEAICIYEKKKWYQFFKRRVIDAVKLIYNRYEVVG